MEYYLAIDIGASSGRHMLGSMQEGKFVLEEVYRFDNGMEQKNGHLCWNYDKLFAEIIEGMKRCAAIGKQPKSVGIDTWGVDFVLLDDGGEIVGEPIGYRDSRTNGVDELFYRDVMTEEELYKRTGIQKAIYNTVYQLYALKLQQPEQLERAVTCLMTPSYFHYRLCGVKCNEYTLATTTQLVNQESRDWDEKLLAAMGMPAGLMAKIEPPKTVLGNLLPEIEKQVGYSCEVVLPCCHDTASAVLSVPAADDNFIYISSGTWSLMGVEREKADCSSMSHEANFTNEGGYGYRFRYLKNIMGLWMIQSIKKECKEDYSFTQLCEMAEKEKAFPSRVDVDDARFLAPVSMTEEVKKACKEQDMPVPETTGELASCIYQSLAEAYKGVTEEIERNTGRSYDKIHIVGGGANAKYLNQLTAQATKKTVYTGPTEATAIGNITAQMMAAGVFGDVREARRVIAESFDCAMCKEVL